MQLFPQVSHWAQGLLLALGVAHACWAQAAYEYRVPIKGLVVLQQLTITPPIADFGVFPVGSFSAPATLTLTNTGTELSTYASYQIVETLSAGQFTVDDSQCGTLAPKQSCTITVRYRPQAEGLHDSILSFKDAIGNSAGVQLFAATPGAGLPESEESVDPPTPPAPPAPPPTQATILINMEGLNGSQTIRDEMGHEFLVHGALTYTTGNYKIGTSSLMFRQNNGITVRPRASDFLITDDFTVETWYRYSSGFYGDNTLFTLFSETPSSPSTSKQFSLSLNKPSSGAATWVIRLNVPRVGSTASGWKTVCNYSNPDYLYTWRHVALVRASGTTKLYVDGQEQTNCTSAIYKGPLGATDQPFYIGKGSPVEGQLIGYLDGFRFTNGTAHYTSNFTPPLEPYALPTDGYATYVYNQLFKLNTSTNAGLLEGVGTFVPYEQ